MAFLLYASCLDNSNHTVTGHALLATWALCCCQSAQRIVRYHLTRDCVREAKTWQLKRRVAKIVAPVFRAKDAGVVRCAYHLACEMLEECCPKAAAIMEEAEVDALAYLDFPCSHWKRLRTNNVQERTNRIVS